MEKHRITEQGSRAAFFLGLKSLYQEPETARIHRQMTAWMRSTLAWVEKTLRQHPPAWPEPEVRRQALYLLDEPLHVLSAPVEPPVIDFLNHMLEKAVNEIENEPVTSGMTVWKMYNHGFIVKTPEMTIGFDLVRGAFDPCWIETALFDRLLRATQVLFISHDHPDHVAPYAIERMVAWGRPVITPPEMWQDRAISAKFVHAQRDPDTKWPLLVGGVSITFRVFPGHQDEVINNAYWVQLPGDLRNAHRRSGQ